MDSRTILALVLAPLIVGIVVLLFEQVLKKSAKPVFHSSMVLVALVICSGCVIIINSKYADGEEPAAPQTEDPGPDPDASGTAETGDPPEPINTDRPEPPIVVTTTAPPTSTTDPDSKSSPTPTPMSPLPPPPPPPPTLPANDCPSDFVVYREDNKGGAKYTVPGKTISVEGGTDERGREYGKGTYPIKDAIPTVTRSISSTKRGYLVCF